MKDFVCFCQVCGDFFSSDFYEEYPLEKGHCRFCNHNHVEKFLPWSEYEKLQSNEKISYRKSLYKEFEKNPYYDEELCCQRKLYRWSIYKHDNDIYEEDELIERSRKLSLWETWFKSKERKALEEKYPEDITPEEAPKPYYKSLKPYETEEEDDEEEEIEAPKAKYIPRCPTCGSPNVINRGNGLGKNFYGQMIHKQYVCKNCGYEW